MNLGMKFRLYPNKIQQNLIQQTFGCTRFVYNHALAFCINQYECGNSIGYKETNTYLQALKHNSEHQYDWLNDVDAHSLQQCLRDLDRAYKNFFAKRAKFPKFKSKHNHSKSYRTECVNNNITVVRNYIKLPKLGYVKARVTMPVPFRILNATIEQAPSGKYFAVLTVEVSNIKPLPNGNGEVGIDVGIKDFYVDSNGNRVSNNKFLKQSQIKLKKAQKRLSKKHKDSHNWEKQRIKVARIYEHITNQRNDFLQKQSTKLIKENQIICIEDLNVKGMIKNHRLANSIADVSWSKFINMLEYKAYPYGCTVVKVPRFYASSQICHVCGKKSSITKDLSVRDWICPHCGTHLDRDVNAAVNILNKGKEILKQQLQTV